MLQKVLELAWLKTRKGLVFDTETRFAFTPRAAAKQNLRQDIVNSYFIRIQVY